MKALPESDMVSSLLIARVAALGLLAFCAPTAEGSLPQPGLAAAAQQTLLQVQQQAPGDTALGGKLSSPQAGMWLYEDLMMASALRIEIHSDSQRPQLEAALQAALSKAGVFVAQASAHDAESTIGRFNQPDFKGPMPCSKELFACLQLCADLQLRSAGAFDAACGQSVRLWRRARQQQQLPSDEQIETARANSGWQQLELQPESCSISKKNPQLRLDLGGIGKGYVVDMLFEQLQTAGFKRLCVAIAGDLRVGDAPPGRKHWRIGLGLLDKKRSQAYVNLSNAALSSSGDLHQGAVIAGQRYSHIIDLRSGKALRQSDAVSVIASRSALADALATSACVMGNDVGWLQLAKHYGCVAVFARQTDNNGVKLDFSNGFEAYCDKNLLFKQ